MKYFVEQQSVVRKIWGKSDTILFIFAGAAGEFALNKAVDWLYYTGKLPSDPLGRLFSTVQYARKIVFAPEGQAYKAIESMRKIHTAVEESRGASIPDWAYRDVLFMLVHYSIAAHELLEQKLSDTEKAAVYNVFYRVGIGMGIKDLPANYNDWLPIREAHLQADLQKSNYTTDLFRQYKKHLGVLRYKVLLESQKLVCPNKVKTLLEFNDFSLLKPIIPLYKLSRFIKLNGWIKELLLPAAYKKEILSLDKFHLQNK
ncbi:oxygenase MpaB family protein [Flavobacterium sp.]|uniref:oxygenase MpaB family protein n=1 Tax=Flavobacterium sp. TaxID=239 RepID=UPI0025D1A8A8|nr:oxygenase MpaB family protein [Flavobacterium sp.]